VQVALHGLLQIPEANFQCDGYFKLIPRWDECILVLRDYIKK
jgi:hypothetical protein